MKLRGNLFIKIFFGFWLVTTTILGSWLLSAHYFESRFGGGPPEKLQQGPPHRFLLRTIYSLQHQEEQEVRALIARAAKEHNVQIYLLDRAGEDMFGRPVPAEARRVAGQLRGARRRAFLNTPQSRLLAHGIYRPEQGPLRAVFIFRPPRHDWLDTLGSNHWLRIVLAVLISGLVCYGLSRLMTTRLKELQLASRRLASGQLDTRLLVREQGGDETDELARDFNSMAEQLQERIQAQKRLLGDVSHELRSPLARLRIALALAQEDKDKSASHLKRIEQEAERLEELISQLLTSQATDINPDAHIDLVQLLQHLCADANFEGQALGKQVTFDHQLEQAVVASSGDLLHKSFDNILRNALLHTADNSRVTVTLDRLQDDYRIRIQDEGHGVPEEDLKKIFGEFYRVDTARARETGGYGLGLAIARRAILRHGGRVEAHNTDTGLEVTVSLPIS